MDATTPPTAAPQSDSDTYSSESLSTGDPSDTPEPSVSESDKIIEVDLERAISLKDSGNEAFKDADYDVAILFYTDSLKYSPKDHPQRAYAFCNRALCKMKQENFNGALKDCNKSLEVDPDYRKAKMRRLECLEQLERWTEASEGWKDITPLDANERSRKAKVEEEALKQRQKAEEQMKEALGKLKSLGNKILGKFGLSLDNFKMEKGPDGSYSIQTKPGNGTN